MDQTREFLGWCLLINLGLLLYWGVMLMGARKWLYGMHTRFISVDEERFNAIHYAGMAIYKVAIFMFLLVPWIVLGIMS
jgi:hypothetical protein